MEATPILMESHWPCNTAFTNLKIGVPVLARKEAILDNEGMRLVSGPTARPLLKWVGGKQAVVRQLTARLPGRFGRYYEPFFGGGALFFALQPERAFLSDVNPDLMSVYKVVRDQVELLLPLLNHHRDRHSREYFYRMRDAFNQGTESEVSRAALFIYLNKSCYNGLFRLNAEGKFNSPVGSYVRVSLYQRENLLACSTALQGKRLYCRTFSQTRPQAGDFVYFDPPYHQNFSAYCPGGFAEDEQRRLAAYCDRLHRRGVKFMLSNSNTPFVRDLYRDYSCDMIAAPRSVNCRGEGRQAQELLIRNYI